MTESHHFAINEEARTLYTEYLGEPDSRKLLDFIKERLDVGEGDVVKEMLAYITERLIEMNNEKSAEIRGFIDWLEGETGAHVEELENRTAIEEYYARDFEDLVKALSKSRKKLKKKYDPENSETKEKLRDKFDPSVERLSTLLKSIWVTDKLIDQIIYEMQELTGDGIEIVEESISVEKEHDGPD